MEAPRYLPATRFVPPVRQPRVLNTRDASIAELMAIPPVWAVVVAKMPAMALAVKTPMMTPNLGNMSLRDIAMFTGGSGDALDAIDAQLKALGPVA
ncbi:MAG: hypothetical protein KGK11_11210 [Sphingomonadales bacterium]|nr:hypothetical protein [Sphingomonadales bacterium]